MRPNMIHDAYKQLDSAENRFDVPISGAVPNGIMQQQQQQQQAAGSRLRFTRLLQSWTNFD